MTRSQAIRITKLMPNRYEIAYLEIESIDLYQKPLDTRRDRMPQKPTYQPTKENHEPHPIP